jgi:hypothetical protein
MILLTSGCSWKIRGMLRFYSDVMGFPVRLEAMV